MKAILFLPTQGPHLPRTGAAEQFDWRAQCRLAAALQKALADSIIYVPSAFQQAGTRSELEFYGEQLRNEGVPHEAIQLDRQGYETVEQCELAIALAEKESARLIVISCHVHFGRVRYLLKGHPVEHVIAHGTPSPWLHFTHLVLGLGFPVLDKLGLRDWWKHRVTRRRLQGKQ